MFLQQFKQSFNPKKYKDLVQNSSASWKYLIIFGGIQVLIMSVLSYFLTDLVLEQSKELMGKTFSNDLDIQKFIKSDGFSAAIFVISLFTGILGMAIGSLVLAGIGSLINLGMKVKVTFQQLVLGSLYGLTVKATISIVISLISILAHKLINLNLLGWLPLIYLIIMLTTLEKKEEEVKE